MLVALAQPWYTTSRPAGPRKRGQGSRLKFDAAAADEGIYFVATAGGETKVTLVTYNKPGRLDFLVPATLVPGTYNLEVRARQGTPPAGPDTRELRIGRLDATLTV